MRPKIANLTIIVLVICLGAASAILYRQLKSEPATSDQWKESPPVDRLDFSDKDLGEISAFMNQAWRGENPTPLSVLDQPCEGVYLGARQQGLRPAEAWGLGENASAAVLDGIQKLRQELDANLQSIDTLEVFFIAASQDTETSKRLFSNIRRGVHGLEIRHGDQRTRYSPTYTVASNRKNERLIELYKGDHSLNEAQVAELSFRFLRGPQLLVPVAPSPGPALRMERGNTYVPYRDVTQSSVEAFAERMATWMAKNLHADGRMTYLYWPSRNEEAPKRDNLIRQFMATVALGRIASRVSPAEAEAAWQRSRSNLQYNLEKYYRQEDEFGFVEGRGSAKLGSAALAALAIVEHPQREQWREQEEGLRRTVQSLWREDGSFRSFYKPATRNDNQNFYPGEALLLWATLYSQSKDEALLAQFMKSFQYYKAWHLDESVANRRNPAFTPWHTQAYFMVWTQTKSDELRDFIFEMNDWLVPIQEWQGTRYRDTKGRFHDSKRPFGPPHASSTGVYLEGLVDAYALAKSVGDEARMKRYATAMRRGLRSSMQLQFVDDVDMFYIGDRDAVFGGLRTTVYNNQIRCDNVQHTLMGTQKILEAGLLPRSVKELPASR
jgi:hypothetical protein